MPVQQIILQPATNSLNAAYQPIVLRVQATSDTNMPIPPVVYCDIYINGIFYRTLSNTQYAQLNEINSEWEFPIQSAVQEVLGKYLGANGGSTILKPTAPLVIVFCRFRSTTLVDGFIESEDTAPIQATGSTDAVSGTGYQSNSFIVLNTALQQEDNPDLAAHLNSYKNGNWDAQAFPLTHRPNRYLIGKNDSDYFPFIYTGNKVARCLKLTVNKKDGTTAVYNNCESLPACGIAVKNITIRKDAIDHGDGRTYYNAIFSVTNTVDHYLVEISYDNGNTWQDITNNPAFHTIINYSTLNYNANEAGTPASHMIRITPYCDDARAGTGATASYTLPVCPTVTNLSISYNAQTQQMSYFFIDANNTFQSITLRHKAVGSTDYFNYGATYNDAPQTGSWTIQDPGDFYVEVTTPCSIGDAVVETSNTITVAIANPICAMPTNVVVNFTPDGNSLVATWQVADSFYSDLVKWYDGDNNILLQQQLVRAPLQTATISVANMPRIAHFFCTVQHQCPSPSVLGVSNVVARDSRYNLVLFINATRDTINVECYRYGQLAPAPFTAVVGISLSYTTGDGNPPITTVASNYLIKGDSSNYIMGSTGISIVTANITSVSPDQQGGFSYIF